MNLSKQSLQKFIIDNLPFFITYLIVLIGGAVLLLYIHKGDDVIYFNDWRGSYWDAIFIFFSNLGEGLYFGLFLLVIGIFSLRYIIIGVTVYLGSGAITQILKTIFEIPRPKIYFANSELVTYVSDIKLLSSYSFPSGHTTSGFAIFLFLALITRNKYYGPIFLFCALLVGISRIYLAQHFLLDVYIGSLIGVIFTLLIFRFFVNSQKISNSQWYNFSFVDYLKNRLHHTGKI